MPLIAPFIFFPALAFLLIGLVFAFFAIKESPKKIRSVILLATIILADYLVCCCSPGVIVRSGAEAVEKTWVGMGGRLVYSAFVIGPLLLVAYLNTKKNWLLVAGSAFFLSAGLFLWVWDYIRYWIFNF
jgi:hypothetical protein